jgi:hypothetical protein
MTLGIARAGPTLTLLTNMFNTQTFNQLVYQARQLKESERTKKKLTPACVTDCDEEGRAYTTAPRPRVGLCHAVDIGCWLPR